MSRALPLLLAGWLLGVATTFVVTYAVPNLLYERKTIPRSDLEQATRDGWIVDRVHDQAIINVERPRLRLP